MNNFQSFSNFPAQNEDESGKKIRKLQNIASVVIRQVRNQPDINFSLFGMPFQILKIVAIVRDIHIESTMAIYKIEDHTGTIRAISWLENESDIAELPPVNIGNYIQLFGCMRMHVREKIIAILHFDIVHDANVITTHLLETIRIRMEVEAKSKQVPNITLGDNPCAALASSMRFLEDPMQDKNEPQRNKLQLKVIQVLHDLEHMNPQGIYIEELLRHFQPFQFAEVKRALQCLLEDGYAYTTIDDYHVKLTSTM